MVVVGRMGRAAETGGRWGEGEEKGTTTMAAVMGDDDGGDDTR